MMASDKAASCLSKASLPCAKCCHASGISGTPKTNGSSEPCVDRAFDCKSRVKKMKACLSHMSGLAPRAGVMES